MNTYDDIKDKRSPFQKLTGWTIEEFAALLPIFKTHFLESVSTKVLDGQERKKRRWPLTKTQIMKTNSKKILIMHLRPFLNRNQDSEDRTIHNVTLIFFDFFIMVLYNLSYRLEFAEGYSTNR